MTDQQPTVTKDEGFAVYRVRTNYEYATIAIREWQGRGIDDTPRELGEILIYSSFGSWAYQWGHLGRPFKRWLLTAEFDYVFTKFMGTKLRVFDGEGSVKEMRCRVIEKRRYGDIDKPTARALWDELEANESEAESSERDFVETMSAISQRFEDGWSVDTDDIERLSERQRNAAMQLLSEPWERIARKHDHQAVGFWRDIWPVFINYLRAELEPDAIAA